MTTHPKQNNATIIELCTKRLAAIPKYVQAKQEVDVVGTPYKPAALTKVFQECIDTRAVVDAKRAELKAALADMQQADQARRTVDKALKSWVLNKFKAGTNALHEFGYPTPKGPTMTVAERNAAITQAKATREARKRALGDLAKKKGATVAPTAPAEPAINVVAPPAPASNGITNGVAHN